jgi:hypothetical protein
VAIVLPIEEGELDMSNELVAGVAEDKEKAKKDAKRFRMCIQGQTQKYKQHALVTPFSGQQDSTASKDKPDNSRPVPSFSYTQGVARREGGVLSKAVTWIKAQVRPSRDEKEAEDIAKIKQLVGRICFRHLFY